MNLTEKQEIAATARKLIRLLKMCDDENYVDEVIDCVQCGDEMALEPQYL